MEQSKYRDFVIEKMGLAGITINGLQPWDLQVKDDRFYERVLRDGSLGLGESYMAGWIDSSQFDEFVHRILISGIDKIKPNGFKDYWIGLQAIVQNLQSKKRSLEVGKKHYDIGNDLFRAMLDKRMSYSCAYWKNAKNLNEAQEAKLDLVCRKIGLKPGMKVLDIGCGWGSFAKFAAEKYQARVVGITISQRQLDLAKELCKGYPIELRFQDYRDVSENFDHIVSIGQMEHVGYKNYRQYMETVHRCLNDEGLFLLHTIGSNTSEFRGDPWLEKYIFPNGMLPSISQIAVASENLFVMEDWHNFGAYYDQTLMAWHHNFVKSWDFLRAQYGTEFYRMWNYYLLSLAGLFRARRVQLWQIVFSKRGVKGGYNSVR